MATTITVPSTTLSITPTLVLGYEATRPARNITHEVLGTGARDVTLRPAAPRSGTLRLFFTTAATAQEAMRIHALPVALVLDDTDLANLRMAYAVTGQITLALDESRMVWTVDVPFEEVS
jgi:hypothetical protein